MCETVVSGSWEASRKGSWDNIVPRTPQSSPFPEGEPQWLPCRKVIAEQITIWRTKMRLLVWGVYLRSVSCARLSFHVKSRRQGMDPVILNTTQKWDVYGVQVPVVFLNLVMKFWEAKDRRQRSKERGKCAPGAVRMLKWKCSKHLLLKMQKCEMNCQKILAEFEAE